VATNAGRLISGGGSDNKIQIGCNIHRLPQFVNLKFPAKSCGAAGYLGWRSLADAECDLKMGVIRSHF